jgi:hypothetical protein
LSGARPEAPAAAPRANGPAAPRSGGPASPARLRAILILILVVCSLIGTAGFFYGRWLMEHPPATAKNLPGH